MGMYYDRDGRQIELEVWAKLFENQDYKRVDYTVIHDKRRLFVSTVWLGLDHNFTGKEKHIYETMVFSNKLSRSDLFDGFKYNKSYDEYTRRYSNLKAAEKGHRETVNQLMREMRD